jgi:hypothetical protein
MDVSKTIQQDFCFVRQDSGLECLCIKTSRKPLVLLLWRPGQDESSNLRPQRTDQPSMDDGLRQSTRLQNPTKETRG